MTESGTPSTARTALTLTLSQRERGYKRRALKLLVFLLAFLVVGAIINIAVALVCALKVHGVVHEFGRPPTNAEQTIWSLRKPEGYPQGLGAVRVSKAFGLRMRHFLGDMDGRLNPSNMHDTTTKSNVTPVVGTEVSAGWPMKSLAGMQWTSTEGRSTRVQTSLYRWRRWPAPASGRSIPYKPVWPGFAINTIFYAAVLWVLFALPGKVRRWRRIKRGQCASCGYSLRDITSEKCPECGNATVFS
jgi:hypothetical protein